MVGQHKRCCINYDPSHFRLQNLDYVGFIDVYHERIKAFHVKDAELRSTPKQGVYSGFADWPDRAGRFRSPGDGDVDFGAIFTQLSVHNYDSWAVLEWECAIKNRDDGAREGAPFIQKHLIKVSETTFDDFIDQGADREAVRRALGLNSLTTGRLRFDLLQRRHVIIRAEIDPLCGQVASAAPALLGWE